MPHCWKSHVTAQIFNILASLCSWTGWLEHDLGRRQVFSHGSPYNVLSNWMEDSCYRRTVSMVTDTFNWGVPCLHVRLLKFYLLCNFESLQTNYSLRNCWLLHLHCKNSVNAAPWEKQMLGLSIKEQLFLAHFSCILVVACWLRLKVSYCDQSSFVSFEFHHKNSEWVWLGNTTITNCRQPRGTTRKSRSTITRHQEDKLSKAISSLFPIKMIAILEWT